MKRVLWSIFLTVVCMLLTVQCVPAPTSISSFVVKSLNTKTSSWAEASHIEPREDVRLECTTTEFSQVKELHITRADGFPLSKSHTKPTDMQNQSLVVILKSVECSQMGTYVCENGRGDKKTVDLGIYGCPPQPCKDQSPNITLYASVNITTQFSVCVEAFPKLSSLFFFNGIEVRFNRTNDFPEVYCTQNKSQEVFSTYENIISCTMAVTREMNNTVNNFSIPSGAAQNQIVKFLVQIEEPGPPECTTGIISTNQGRDSITLSWQPVNNRGGSQPVNYTIFYTTNETEWQRYNTVEDAQTTITGLEAEVLYGFRVASANEYSQVIDENTCNETVEVKIAPSPTSTTAVPSTDAVTLTKDNNSTNTSDESTILYIIIAILSVLVIIIVIIGVVRCRLDRIFERLRSHSRNARSTRSHRNGRHNPETTQQTSLRLFNFRHKSNLPYHNINAGESM